MSPMEVLIATTMTNAEIVGAQVCETRVRARSQIARTHGDFRRFSEMSENSETEVWSEWDSN